jgi:uncharacterized protein YciI
VAGLLVLLAILMGVVWLFAALFRKRVRARLESTAPDLSAELTTALRARSGTPHAPVTAAPAPAAAPIAAALPVAPKATAVPALHFMLIYEVWPDFLQQRAKYRDEHLALAWKAAAAGELQLAGALEEGTAQAFLLFRSTREAAQRFAQADPYVRHGLVKHWHVRQWHTTVGEGAAMPMRPGAPGPKG